MQHNRMVVHGAILAITIIFASVVLLVGYDSSSEVPQQVAVGSPAPKDFTADSSTGEFFDEEKTIEERELAANNVPAVFEINTTTSQNVINSINALFTDLEESAFLPQEAPEMVDVPNLINLSIADAEAAAQAVGLDVAVTGTIVTTDETLDGVVAAQIPIATISVETGSVVSVSVFTIAGSTTTTEPPTTTTTVAPNSDRERRPIEGENGQIELLEQNHAVLGIPVLTSFVELYNKDLDRVEDGGSSVFPDMQSTAIGWAEDELTAGIRDSDIGQVRQKYSSAATRPPLFIAGIPEEDVDATHTAIATLVGIQLASNEQIDQVQWEIEKEAARAAVPDQTTSYSFGDRIAEEGEILNSVQVSAINELGLYEPDVTLVAPGWALALVGALSILVFAFLMWRIAPQYLDRTRDVVLLAIILSLAVLTAKVPEFVVSADNHSIGYVMPAVAIGVMAAILFDQRTALLVALPLAGFTAIATTDITFTVFAAIAAAIPVAFVSSVSTRSQLRLSVLASAAVVAPVAAGLEFLFHYGLVGSTAWQAALWAFLGAVIGGFLAQGLVSFLESAFGVTTTMSLLDLLDRNHPALQELEQKAPGTFNHSMLVGSLAGRAARSIGADPLLAQGAAWYHDLGKTEHPQYFVENQLGYNPHDELTPIESAQIIRGHVSDGLELAKQFRIPDDVADGIRMHHGTSLMRYFYHKALTQDPDVDPEQFRHHGIKPHRKEMAIVMVSDATEAAARAYAQTEQPTEAGLRKLVDDIVSEKLEDGQFDDSSLTFGDVTTIKREIVSGLSAYYHARVEYPDFPTAEVT